MYMNRGIQDTLLNQGISMDIPKSDKIDMVPNWHNDVGDLGNEINKAQLNEWLGLDFSNTIQPEPAIDCLTSTFQPEPEAVDRQTKQIHALQCEILMQCIEDIKENAKKHHVQFMLSTINNGTLRDIERISTISHSQAKKLYLERKRGIYKVAKDMTRAGLSKTCIQKLIRQNS
jgi:hypothetical protein